MILRIAASVIARSPGKRPCRVKLLGDDIFLGDMRLLLLAVAGELDDIQRSQSAGGMVSSMLRRGDEHDLRQVESDVEVVIAKRRVLLGVEDFQKRAEGSPRKSEPILSISSSMKTGLLVPALRMP